MNKTDLLFQMMEQPKRYTAEEWQEILADDECYELYTLMSKTQSAIDGANANEEVTDDMRSTASGLTLVEDVPDKSTAGFIKNPLPGPKPHVARELTYDYEFKDDDLEFDITDMKGKDYYDI